MIKYLVIHGTSRIEFSLAQEATDYATANGCATPTEFKDAAPPPSAPPPFDFVALVRRAREHGQNVADQFAAENIAMDITRAGKTKLVADAARDIAYYLSTGSLYEALSACDRVVLTPEMVPFLTPSRLTAFKANISAFFEGA